MPAIRSDRAGRGHSPFRQETRSDRSGAQPLPTSDRIHPGRSRPRPAIPGSVDHPPEGRQGAEVEQFGPGPAMQRSFGSSQSAGMGPARTSQPAALSENAGRTIRSGPARKQRATRPSALSTGWKWPETVRSPGIGRWPCAIVQPPTSQDAGIREGAGPTPRRPSSTAASRSGGRDRGCLRGPAGPPRDVEPVAQPSDVVGGPAKGGPTRRGRRRRSGGRSGPAPAPRRAAPRSPPASAAGRSRPPRPGPTGSRGGGRPPRRCARPRGSPPPRESGARGRADGSYRSGSSRLRLPGSSRRKHNSWYEGPQESGAGSLSRKHETTKTREGGVAAITLGPPPRSRSGPSFRAFVLSCFRDEVNEL